MERQAISKLNSKLNTIIDILHRKSLYLKMNKNKIQYPLEYGYTGIFTYEDELAVTKQRNEELDIVKKFRNHLYFTKAELLAIADKYIDRILEEKNNNNLIK